MSTEMTLTTIKPNEAIIDGNVRTLIDLDPEFVNSIRQRGILQPPTGWIDEDGIVHIEVGQRRTLAATQVGLESIPVILKSRHDAEADRYIDQLVENDRRQPLTTQEHLAAYEQLTLFGLKPDEIAKRTGSKRDDVRRSVKVLKDQPRVTEVLEVRQVDLEQAALIAEFADHEDLVAELTEIAVEDPSRLQHEIDYAKSTVETREQLEVLRGKYSELYPNAKILDSIKVIEGETEGSWSEFNDQLLEAVTEDDKEEDLLASLDQLRIGDSTHELTIDEAYAQGGLIIVFHEAPYWQRRDGELVSTEVYVELPLTHGYRFTDGEDLEAGLTEEQLEQRREREAAQLELQQRRDAFERAERVRHQWIRDDLLHDRKKLPAGVGAVLLDAELGGGFSLPVLRAHNGGVQLAAEFLGIATDDELRQIHWWESQEERERLNVFRDLARSLGHERVLLAFALGKAEQTARAGDRDANYFELLESWGYGLSDIERSVITERDQALASEQDEEEI